MKNNIRINICISSRIQQYLETFENRSDKIRKLIENDMKQKKFNPNKCLD